VRNCLKFDVIITTAKKNLTHTKAIAVYVYTSSVKEKHLKSIIQIIQESSHTVSVK